MQFLDLKYTKNNCHFFRRHDPLLKAAFDFIFQNRPIKKDSYWDKIKTTYPEIATKILDLVVLNVKAEGLKKD